MTRVTPMTLSLLLLCLGCPTNIALADNREPINGTANKQTTKLVGRLNYLEAACGSVGIQLADPTVPTKVTKVRMGTPAFHAGIRQGDQILNYKTEGEILRLEIERQGQKFSLHLPMNMKALRQLTNSPITQPQTPASRRQTASVQMAPGPKTPELAAQSGLVDKVPPDTPAPSAVTNLEASAQQSKLELAVPEEQRLLRQRHIILIVDKSGSMATKDPACDGLTRFEWCKQAISGLATAPELTDKLFTLIFFNTDTDVIRGCDAKLVERMFSLTSPDGGTDLSLAITEALNAHKNDQQQGETPAVIAVLHDGVVNRGKGINALLVEAGNQQTNSKQLAITFLQIGQDRKGTEMLADLDSGLIAKGAKWDIVDAVPFAHLKEIGLQRALINAIKEATQHAN